jgi:hypothetical protein
MASVRVLTAVAFVVLGAAPQALAQAPVVRIADPQSLQSVITFGSLAGESRGTVYWKADIALPPRGSIDRAAIIGLSPAILRLKDGRCFKVETATDPNARYHLSSVRSLAMDCPPERHIDTSSAVPPHAGMRYVGRAFDIDAWTDPHTGITSLNQVGKQGHAPLLTTGMRIVALGGLGSPDAGATEIRLLGYVGRQLTLAEIDLGVSGS